MKLTQISEHVYWMPPAKPDRPSLCAVKGSDFTLMLDSGASAAHAQLFIEALQKENIPAPRYVVLTHWHWDHVFGAASLNIPVIAHADTAKQLKILAGYDWSNQAIDDRVKTGEEIESCARDIKLELPEPRHIQIKQPEIIFQNHLEIHLGNVTCKIQHVGGDHAADSCVIHVDNVLFMGDCLYEAIYTPVRHYSPQNLFPLLDKVLNFEAEHFIEGHTDTVMSRAEVETMAAKMRLAGNLVEKHGNDVPPQTDEEVTYFINSLLAVKLMKK